MNIDFLRDFQRILRLKDIEVWDIKIQNKACRMVIVDEHRPSVDSDFPWLRAGIGEEKRKNHITIYIFTLEDLEDHEQTVLYNIAEHLTDHVALAHCNVTVLFEKVQNHEVALDPILQSKGYPGYDSIQLEHFFYFSQD
ncbi:hypothetical protein B9G55_22815 [Saccharibacillus sp. O16]|nr:hypothetical protein B9G55_22815 [Saccharibacillus sp. O16]